MSFTSVEFLLFLPSVLVLYTAIFAREHLRDVFLLCVSYLFYMSWNWRYAGLILFSTGVDYCVGLWLARETHPGRRRLLLILSLGTNLGLLGLFKYFNFFADLAEGGFHAFGLDLSLFHHKLLLPVGISFYTFQTMSYTIDVYRGVLPHERSFLKFAVYVSFFPQLVAGPIVRASAFLPQLHRTPDVSAERVSSGLALVFQGLVKKILIADLLAGLGVDAVFADPAAYSSWDLLFGLYGYAFQIYADFSGYSDIAIGVGRMLGFDLPENFRRPYLARNAREFWTRWHISLSSWLRDYLYIPLGGNRVRPRRVQVNLMITMLLGGLWHGAALNFLCWGAYHGALLVLTRSYGQTHHASRGRIVVDRVIFFHLVIAGWLLFRVSGMAHFLEYVQGLGALTVTSRLHAPFYLILVLAVIAHIFPQEVWERTRQRWVTRPVPVQALAFAALLLLFLGVRLGTPAFIYFQF